MTQKPQSLAVPEHRLGRREECKFNAGFTVAQSGLSIQPVTVTPAVTSRPPAGLTRRP